MTGSTNEDALAFRTRQVAELRGLLAQRSAELEETQVELAALRAELAAGPVTSEAHAAKRGKWRWRDLLP